MTRVAVVTDNDFDKINGVTTTLRAVLKHAPPDIEVRIYTAADFGVDEPHYLALRSWGCGVPWYREMRMYWPQTTRLLQAIRAAKTDVIHITTPGPLGLAARYVALRLNLPVVGSFHTRLGDYVGVLSRSPRLGHWFNRYMRWVYGPCQPLLVPTTGVAARLVRMGYRPTQLAVWSRGVDSTRFTPDRASAALRERWRVSERRPAVLYVGRLSSEKGLALVEPIGRLLDQQHVAHRFVFVGDGPMRRDLMRLCPDAVFTGSLPHDEVARVMASADIFLFPSITDTLGNVVLEAQASGLPVVVADSSGPGEAMIDGATGVVCPSATADELSHQLAALLSVPALRCQMGRAARVYAEQRRWATTMAPLFGSWRGAQARAARRRSLTPGFAVAPSVEATAHVGDDY